MATDDSAQLRARLENLPQELYDQIYDFTFTAEPGVRYLDRFNPCPPVLACEAPELARPLLQKSNSVKLLHVDRTSRRKFAQSFYGGEGAVFVAESHRDGLIETFHCWLRLLPLDHQAMVRDARAIIVRPPLVHRVLGFNDEYYSPGWEISYMGDRFLRAFGRKFSEVTAFGAEDKITADLPDYYRRGPIS